MSRSLLALFALLAIFYATEVNSQCPPGEVWNDCGTACPPSCKNPNPICTLQCVRGCYCPASLVRDNRGRCIPESQCRK